jgi:uncharacterized protein
VIPIAGANTSGGSTDRSPQPQTTVIVAALAIFLVVIGGASAAVGVRQALLAVIGFAGGIALYHASFGFTSAWRRMLTDRRSLGLRVQLVMIAATMATFYPLLAHGTAFGQPLYGFVNSVGLALCAGAFLFGVGMQLGGGCGSGTLYTVGGGSTRMLATLAAFIAGSLIATADPLGWSRWPDIGAHSIVDSLGAPAGLIVSLAVITAVYLAASRLERARHGSEQRLDLIWRGSLLRGPWPLLAGALALIVVNVATLLVAGRPWGITSAFALWGAKGAASLGVDVAGWPYWRGDQALSASVFADVTSVMNFGLMLGALVASGIAGKFAPQAELPWRSLAAALIGGLLMGVGARMATGCNIGALFSGLASGSLHGLVWLVFAVPGNAVGVTLRPWFQLD